MDVRQSRVESGTGCTRVPDEHNTVCLVVRRVGTWACNKCTWAECKVQDGLRRVQAQHTGVSLCARRTAKIDRSSFPRPSKVDRVDRFAAIGFAISNGCTVRMVCRGPGLKDVMTDQNPPGPLGRSGERG